MPGLLTLKNIPDDVYLRLKEQAEMHRRSLNREAIVCLETVLTPTKVTVSERLDRARRLRGELKTTFRAGEIGELKSHGRP
ncbi:MAG: plasmid stability protein [Rhodothermia bacterium]